MSEKSFPLLDDHVTVDLGDGKKLPLRFPLITLRRLGKALGRPVMGRASILLDLTEEVLPEIIYYGLCDPKTGEEATAADGTPISLETILTLPSSALGHLTKQFSLAYTQVVPKIKNDESPEKAPAPVVT